MNRAWVYLLALVCLFSFPVMRDLAIGDVAAPAAATALPQDADISATDKQAVDASLYKDEIAGLIKTEVAKLADDSSTDAQGLARDWLIAQVNGGSASFQDLYTTSLNQSLTDLLANSSTTVRAKVNAALVVDGVAGAGGAPALNLAGITTILLGDKADGVVLPAEQAAGKLLALQLAAGGNGAKALLAAMVQGAVNTASAPGGALITQEVYSAINPVLKSIQPNNPAFADIVDANLSLQSQRLKLWADGVPSAPYCDAYPAFAFDQANWDVLTPAQQLQAIQNASDLIAMVGHYATAPGVQQTLKSDLVQVLTQEGDSLEGLASHLGDQVMDQKMIPLKNLGVGSSPAAIKEATDPVYAALQQNPMFSKITPPPNLDQK
jgi:hypothetical protein